MSPPPGQKPALITSCEYASRVIESAPSRGGARRPEKRVTARSKLPQKKCTGLFLQMKRDRNSLKISSALTRMRQNRFAYPGSYDACCVSWSKAIGLGTSHGIFQIVTWIPSESRQCINSL